MTKAVLFADSDGCYTGFSVRGHSDYGEEGGDIVCAAVSILTITCINTLEETAGIKPRVDADNNGDIDMYIPENEPADKMHDAQVIMKYLRKGLKDLADEYPKYIHFSIKERRKPK